MQFLTSGHSNNYMSIENLNALTNILSQLPIKQGQRNPPKVVDGWLLTTFATLQEKYAVASLLYVRIQVKSFYGKVSLCTDSRSCSTYIRVPMYICIETLCLQTVAAVIVGLSVRRTRRVRKARPIATTLSYNVMCARITLTITLMTHKVARIKVTVMSVLMSISTSMRKSLAT